MLQVHVRYPKNCSKHWWISLVAGALGIAAGIYCFITPLESLAALTVFFIAVLLAGGIFNLAFAITNRKWNDNWGWSLARGIIEILLAIWLFMLPLPLVTTTLVYVIGFWMLFHSIVGIIESCGLSRLPAKGWGWLLACNIISLLCAFFFMVSPVYGGLFVLFYIGLSLILYGIYRIVLAFEWRKINKEPEREGNPEVLEAEIMD